MICKRRVYKIAIFVTVCIILIFGIHLFVSQTISYDRLIEKVRESQNECNIAIIDDGLCQKYQKECVNCINLTNDSTMETKSNHGNIMYEIVHSMNYGFATKSNVSMIKVIPNDGQTNISDLTKAIKWCENNKINIISISLSTTKDDNNMHKEIKKATNMGIHIFAAVANDSFFTSYPAAYKEVIGVYSWKKKKNFNEKKYCYVPINKYYASQILQGNSCATACAAAVSSCFLTDKNVTNKTISNASLILKIQEFFK